MVFVKRDKKDAPQDLTIAALQGRAVKRGDVGIELECEGVRLPKEGLGTYWTYVRDGSLRGADSGEYVLKNPIAFDKVDEATDELWTFFKNNNTRLDESIRTSVHVHLNVLPFYQNRLAALLGLWFICEEVLSHFSGDHRVGNLFCIRAKDGPAIIRQIRSWLEAKGHFSLNSDALHYSALNMGALFKYGSIEIRTMRGVTTPDPLKQWVRILKKLYDESANYNDPRTMMEKFSLEGPMDFFMGIFGEEANEILRNVSELNVRDSLFEGMRFAQEVIYARDWTDFNPTKVIMDPFGRKAKMSTPNAVNIGAAWGAIARDNERARRAPRFPPQNA